VDFAGENLELHILERARAAERFRDMLHLDHRGLLTHWANSMTGAGLSGVRNRFEPPGFR
jgi:hypothetical protein